MSRRVTLPGADELFSRTTQAGTVKTTKRTRHDEKITIYLSSEDLLAIEQARLQLKADFAVRVDRGRLVRESIAIVLADMAARGKDSALVRQLR